MTHSSAAPKVGFRSIALLLQKERSIEDGFSVSFTKKRSDDRLVRIYFFLLGCVFVLIESAAKGSVGHAPTTKRRRRSKSCRFGRCSRWSLHRSPTTWWRSDGRLYALPRLFRNISYMIRSELQVAVDYVGDFRNMEQKKRTRIRTPTQTG